MTKTLSTILIIFFFSQYTFSQNRPLTGIRIENQRIDLKKNKVVSIEHNVYAYKNKRKKKLKPDSYSKRIEKYDSLGRIIETQYFLDQTKIYDGRSKYYYLDTNHIGMLRVDTYDAKDSLTETISAQYENGKPTLIIINSGVSCFGNYKFKYDKSGLISEAIWYGPKKGIWANENMTKYYLTKLTYIYK